MADLRKLKAIRAQIKGQVTRLNNFLVANRDITGEQAQARLDKLHELWLAFDENQTQIEVMKAENEEKLEEIAQQEAGEREVFEQVYYRAMDEARSIIAAAQPATRTVAQMLETGSQGNADIKLPTLKLPTFAGEYDRWMLFKDAFQSLIHGNRKLTDVQKFQYLRSTLKDEALEVISGLNTSAENYIVAWNLLKDQYENKKLIINSHLSKLLEFPTVAKDKYVALKQFVMHIRMHLKALQVLGQPTDQWDAIIIFLARGKLDYQSQRAWEEEIRQQELDHMPTIEEFLKFLSERSRTLEMLDSNIGRREATPKNNAVKKTDKRIALTTTSLTCPMCEDSHSLFNCASFLKLSPQDRFVAVKEKQLCINCLKAGHYARECKSSKCRKCSKFHNTLLHKEFEESTKKASQDSSSGKEESKEQAVVMHCVQKAEYELKNQTELEYSHKDSISHVILATAQVYIRDRQGRRQTCRALLDPGSQSHFITEELVKRLQLPCKSESAAINGIMRNITNIESSVKIQIESQNTAFKADLDCLVIPAITEQLPQVRLNKRLFGIPEDHKLADPAFDKPGPVDVLIGAGLFWKLLCIGQIRKARGHPTWQKTQLGWIVGGELIEAKGADKARSVNLLVTNQTLSEHLERFWTQKEVHETRQLNAQEIHCQDYFSKTTRRDATGRFIVRLPKNEDVTLGESKQQAERRFRALERRFRRQPSMKKDYVQFMRDYKEQGHMSLVSPDAIEGKEQCFIPHQPVLRPDSITTKIRVVFDASAKTNNDKALNDLLLAGPNLQVDLLHILLRFRTYEYVINGDIAMMFRQILVAEEDRSLQLVLWRENEEDLLETFSLNTVTYGTTCAPYLAMRCLKQLAIEEGDQFPLAQKELLTNFYMDDVLTGRDDLEEAIQLQRQLTALLAKNQFHLRKWRANDESWII